MEPKSERRYANAFNVGHNAYEVVLEFGQVYVDREGTVLSRIVTTPRYAKRLLETLRDSLIRYEDTYGEIPDDDEETTPEPERTGRRTAMAEQQEPSKKMHTWHHEGGEHAGKPGEPSRLPPYARSSPHEEEHEPGKHGGEPGHKGYEHDEERRECTPPPDQMAQLQALLKSEQARLDALTHQHDALQADITGLQQSATEQAPIVQAYKDAWKALEQKKRDLDCWVGDQWSMLECAVKEEKACIESCISKTDGWIEHWREHTIHLGRVSEEETKEAADAAKEVDNASHHYDDVKNAATGLDATLTELQTIRQLIKDKEAANSVCDAYVLLKELSHKLSEVHIRTWKQLELELCEAWTKYRQAKAEARTTQSDADAAAAAYLEAKTFYESLKASRRDKILACVDKRCCPEKPAPECD